jgi:hypothetical protein
MSTNVHLFSKKRFRFERFWTKMEGFPDVVKELRAWADVHGDAVQRLDGKLRSLARGLQSWSQKKVGSIRDQLSMAHEVILQLDHAQETTALSAEEVRLRRGLKGRVLGLASLDRTIARQRVRVAGIADRDANSQFFRILASSRRRRNFIGCLHHGDRVATLQHDKEELATDFFVDILGRAQRRTHDISLAAAGLAAVDLSQLEAVFSEQEVWTAIKGMPDYKSPGPDGFSWDFYKCCWSIIKVDVLAALRTVFMGQGQHFGRLNGALVTLIPKRKGWSISRIFDRSALCTASPSSWPRSWH